MTFNFENFLADHQFSNWISDLTEVLDGEAEGIPARLQAFREKFKIAPQRQEAEPFRFNLAQRSYETIPAEVLQAGRNLKRCTFVQGDRFFVSRNFQEEPLNQVWEEVASPSSVDIHAESAQLSFLDNEKTQVDWPLTLANLNRMIQNRPYSENMMKSCLLRMVNHYEPRQTEYLKNKTSNEIARFLLSLDSRIDRATFHRTKLHQSVREVNETLSSAVMKVKNIVDQIYPLPVPQAVQAQAQVAVGGNAPPPPEGAQLAEGAQVPVVHAQAQPQQLDNVQEIGEHDSNSIANRILINAIISFVNDELAVPLMIKVQRDNVQSRLMSYQVYLNLAMSAELRSNSYPKVALKYGQKFSPKIADMSLSNTEISHIHPSMVQSFPLLKENSVGGNNPTQNFFYNPNQNLIDQYQIQEGLLPLVAEGAAVANVVPPFQPSVVVQPFSAAPVAVPLLTKKTTKKTTFQTEEDDQKAGSSGLQKPTRSSPKKRIL
jgi:hypothetical protein